MFIEVPSNVRLPCTNQPTAAQTYTVAGTPTTGFRGASGVITDGATVAYTAEQVDGNGNRSGAWETGVGVWTASGTALSRVTIIASSSGSAIDWSAGGVNAVPTITIHSPLSLGVGLQPKATSIITADVASAGFVGRFVAGRNYLLTWHNLRHDQDANSFGAIAVGLTRSGAIDLGATDYAWRLFAQYSSYDNATGTGSPVISGSVALYAGGHASYDADLDRAHGALLLFDPLAATKCQFVGLFGTQRGTNQLVGIVSGRHNFAAAADGVALFSAPGLGTGTLCLYELGGWG